MVADVLSVALSQALDKWGKKMFAPVSNLNRAVLWFLGNRQEFSKAWLHLLDCCLQLCQMSKSTEKLVSSLLLLLRMYFVYSDFERYFLDVDLELVHSFILELTGLGPQNVSSKSFVLCVCVQSYIYDCPR